MSKNREQSLCGFAASHSPQLVVVDADRFVRTAADHLHRLGWEVVSVPSTDALRAAISRKPAAMLLPYETNQETGWLMAAKLRHARPNLKVVLVGQTRTRHAERLASFVGAEFVAATDSVPELLAALAG